VNEGSRKRNPLRRGKTENFVRTANSSLLKLLVGTWIFYYSLYMSRVLTTVLGNTDSHTKVICRKGGSEGRRRKRRKERRKGGREEERKERRKEGREGGKEGGREGGRK
jgi:hypothetical protein